MSNEEQNLNIERRADVSSNKLVMLNIISSLILASILWVGNSIIEFREAIKIVMARQQTNYEHIIVLQAGQKELNKITIEQHNKILILEEKVRVLEK